MKKGEMANFTFLSPVRLPFRHTGNTDSKSKISVFKGGEIDLC